MFKNHKQLTQYKHQIAQTSNVQKNKTHQSETRYIIMKYKFHRPTLITDLVICNTKMKIFLYFQKKFNQKQKAHMGLTLGLELLFLEVLNTS